MKSQHRRFESTYSKNDNANQEQLRIQSRNYAKQLAEEKKKFVQEVQNYEGKSDDPFYRVMDRGSQMKETSSYYVLEAYVPEHEKNNVQVTIQNDKATISGQRSFQDKLAEDDKKISTNTFQTFKEEFEFNQPVIADGMARERSGDYIIVTVPKLISYNRIDRKA